MRNPLVFFVELMQQKLWMPLWVMLLMIVNMASTYFWHEPLAQLIFFTFIASAMIIMILYSRFGFEKILGLGHILWIPLLIYISLQTPEAEQSFQHYLIGLSIIISISLLFDIIDLFKYFKQKT